LPQDSHLTRPWASLTCRVYFLHSRHHLHPSMTYPLGPWYARASRVSCDTQVTSGVFVPQTANCRTDPVLGRCASCAPDRLATELPGLLAVGSTGWRSYRVVPSALDCPGRVRRVKAQPLRGHCAVASQALTRRSQPRDRRLSRGRGRGRQLWALTLFPRGLIR
jgi:hypothetical protein